MGKVTETHTEIHSVTKEGISDSSHKQWMTKKNNKISSLENQLEKSMPKSAHDQWMTKKNNEIAEKDAEIAKLKEKLKEKR